MRRFAKEPRTWVGRAGFHVSITRLLIIVRPVLHYSKPNAEIFLTLVGEAGLRQTLAAAKHLALSRKVAAPLIALGLSPRIAEEPDEAGLLALLK